MALLTVGPTFDQTKNKINKISLWILGIRNSEIWLFDDVFFITKFAFINFLFVLITICKWGQICNGKNLQCVFQKIHVIFPWLNLIILTFWRLKTILWIQNRDGEEANQTMKDGSLWRMREVVYFWTGTHLI